MLTPTDRFNGSAEARHAAGQAWTNGLVGFAVVFVVLMIPWFTYYGAIAAGLSGAAAALLGYSIAQRHMEQARRFYEEARLREDQEIRAREGA